MSLKGLRVEPLKRGSAPTAQCPRLDIRLRFRQPDDFALFLPLPAFFQEIDALETF
jgi:hypothetical protein